MKIIKLVLLVLLVMPIAMKAQKGKVLKVAFISASNEYVSNVTLNQYKKDLENVYPNVKVTLLQADGPVNAKDEFSHLNGTEALKDCDVLLVFARRTTISGKAMDDIRNFVNSGKPIVALRTSSHGFQEWPEFDKTVLGGNYDGHYEGEPEKRMIGSDGNRYAVGEPSGHPQTITINAANRKHPLLKGINNFTSKYSLYKTAPIADDATLLLTGTSPEGTQPVAWTRNYNGAKVVYIALGGVQDWANPNFKKLVTSSIFWTSGFKPKKK